MTNPNTPREDDVQALFTTLSTEQQETIQSASDAIARLQAQAATLAEKTVDDETLAQFTDDVTAIKDSADKAQDAFALIGVTPSAGAKSGAGNSSNKKAKK